tara:strand:- start:44 stop:535 length:492 start_codon:yes stop_codon:yes gene_type:complete
MTITLNGNGTVTGVTDFPVASFGTHGILQVVGAEHSTQVATTSTSYVATNLTVNITPSHANNKILVMTSSPVHIMEEPGTDAQGYLSLERDSTSIATAIFGDHTGNANRADDWGQISLLQLDAPSSTSQIAYNVKIKSGNSGWTAEHCTSNYTATIVCMEVKV